MKFQSIIPFILLILPALMNITSCGTMKEQADLIIYNATIYTCDAVFQLLKALQ
jgi:hypothetical protein